jgi:hypothetical protein
MALRLMRLAIFGTMLFVNIGADWREGEIERGLNDCYGSIATEPFRAGVD